MNNALHDNAVKTYGYELILDIHNCNPKTFNRDSLKDFFETLCDAIKMEACDLHFWDDVGVPEEERQTEPHAKGTSAVQFILTSTIVIHTLDLLEKIFINIFSCKEFDKSIAEKIAVDWFQGQCKNSHFIERH